jgi:hypothetical protein
MIVALSSLITITGLWLVLRKYLSAGTTLATLFLLFLGTNFFLMTVFGEAKQASILFALMTVVVYMTQRWNEKQGWLEVIIAGCCMGCLVFIKPAGFASLLLFVFWGAYDKETFRTKWEQVKENALQLGLLIVLVSAGIVLRLIFPHAFEGIIFNDYFSRKKAVFSLAPWLWTMFFSVRNGWLIYTPLVLCSIPGFYLLSTRNKSIFYATFLYSLVFTLLLASSPIAAVPNSFSQAKMTEVFAVLLIPIGYFVSWIFEGGWPRRILTLLVLVSLAVLNLFQTWQYKTGILNPFVTTPEYYTAVFLKTHAGLKTRVLQEVSSLDLCECLASEKDFSISTIAFQGFEKEESDVGEHLQGRVFYRGTHSFRLDSMVRHTPAMIIKLTDLPASYPLGFRFSAFVYAEEKNHDKPLNLVVTLVHKGSKYRTKVCEVSPDTAANSSWQYRKMDYVIPYQPDQDDELNVFVWYTGTQEIYVDDLKVELFEEK